MINLGVQSIIKNIFGDVRGYAVSSQLQVNCPRCKENEHLFEPDGKFNLEINPDKKGGIFRCWKCSNPPFSGSLGKLVRLYGSKGDYEIYKSYRLSNLTDYSYDDEIEDIIITLPKEFISFSNIDENDPLHLEAYNYLVLDRKISKELILKFKLGFCLEGRYKKRIIIPSYDEYGLINYFIGRNYDFSKKGIIPYDNVKANKDQIIFNEGLINWDSTIYLVEGLFEFLSFPINTIPLLGKTISTALFNKLNKYKPNIVILLDPDAFKNAIELYYTLYSIYIGCEDRVKIIELPFEKDFDLIRKNRGIDIAINCLYNARNLNINDNFIRKMKPRNDGYRRYNKHSKPEWESGSTKQFIYQI
jgi:hypothetical protein